MSYPSDFSQSYYLSVLSRACVDDLKSFVESRILSQLSEVKTRRNRVGGMMVPARDTVTGIPFHLGEALMAEAEVEADGVVGYGACLGRDLEQAVAIAILDAVVQGGRFSQEVVAFVRTQEQQLAQADEALMRKVAATKVEMETFEW